MSSEVHAARTTDAAAVGRLLGLPEPAAARLIRTRTVKVAVQTDEITACLAYDVHDGAVSVTRIGGEPDTFEGLLAEPRRLAIAEGYPVEVLVGTDEPVLAEAIEAVGFTAAGSGPRFEGQSTTRYRWEPTAD